MGDIPDAAPPAGLARAGPVPPSPLRSYGRAVKEMSTPKPEPISRLFNRRRRTFARGLTPKSCPTRVGRLKVVTSWAMPSRSRPTSGSM